MDKVARELAKVKYDKSIMLELVKNRFGKYKISHQEFYKRAADAARRIVDRKMYYEANL